MMFSATCVHAGSLLVLPFSCKIKHCKPCCCFRDQRRTISHVINAVTCKADRALGDSGAVLPIWKVLADTVLPDEEKKSRYDVGGKKEQAHVVRLKLDSGEPIVGLAIHYDDVSRVRFPQLLLSRA